VANGAGVADGVAVVIGAWLAPGVRPGEETALGGGFVAAGDLVAAGTSARTRVWVSADGGTWELLGADVFGPAAVVVGTGAIAGGVVAFTVQSGINSYADDASRSPSDVSSWTLEGPWQS
jgi:hypothetical protein